MAEPQAIGSVDPQARIAEGDQCRSWLAAYTRSRHEPVVATQLQQKGLLTLLPTFIEDCVEGLVRLMASGYREPLNLGTEELISVDGLVDLVSGIAAKRLVKRHDLTKPQGVRGRNSDNSRLRQVLGWEPQIALGDGMKITYLWIQHELRKAGKLPPVFSYAVD